MVALAWSIAVLGLIAALAGAALAWRARRDGAAAGRRAAAADARARTFEQRIQGSFEVLPIVALRVDADGRLLEANRRARERFDFLRPGMGVLEAFSEHELAGRVTAALAGQATDEFEVRLFADGRRTYRVVIEPYRTGSDAEALIALTDTTEAVAYQELRSQFVSNVSHELRTPLTGLRGLLEALDDPDMDAATRQRFIVRAAHESERLEALIGDILFLSELEATEGLPSDGRSDLAAAVEVTVEELRPVADEHGVALSFDTQHDAWTPLTERMARIVVRNLVENAIKYAGAGARTDTVVRIEDGFVELRVTDDGAGIPERQLPHIFERFYRADPSRSKRLGGTGLGLSIVKHISERFGGRATATSREGFGTTVTVHLPLEATDAEGPEGDQGRAERMREAPLRGDAAGL